MNSRFPPPNMPPEAMPWVRDVMGRLGALEMDSSRTKGSELNTNKSQNSTINVLNGQVSEIQTAVSAAATAEELASVAAASRIYPYVDSAGVSGFTLTTGGITVISRSVPVPAGFTRAVVIATGFVNGLGSSSGDRIFGVVTIDGNSGQESQAIGSVNQQWAAVGPSHSASISGLSGTFSVDLQARVQTGPGSNLLTNATLTIMALFLP